MVASRRVVVAAGSAVRTWSAACLLSAAAAVPYAPPMRYPVAVAVVAFLAASFGFSCQSAPAHDAQVRDRQGQGLGSAAHREEVMTSRFCAECHPAMYAEHRQNTHGRAFFDEEARLATRGFRREDCIRCHTPRPVFETGIGMTPMARWTNLEEGNTCISCHGRDGYDYSRFEGGTQCLTAFEPEVGTVADCATCHRIAGTPFPPKRSLPAAAPDVGIVVARFLLRISTFVA